MTKSYSLNELTTLVGHELGTSDWLLVDQARIQAFATATLDEQWIHVDPKRAARGPFGVPIAHGFLTLSLLPRLIESAFVVSNVELTINYGLNRVRFPAVLPAGSRIRGHCRLLACDPLEHGAQLVVQLSVEREGHVKPVCVAESVLRHFVSQ